jgi:class 3 adenylate cyclase
MTSLPSGTVTLLMSDIVASTERWAARVELPSHDLDRLDALINDCVHAEAGVVVKARGEGDSHFAAFDRPSAGLKAAAAIQRRALERCDAPSIRIAVTAGELYPREADYVGALVNRTARIRSAAHGGQIVCTRPVTDIAMPIAGLGVRSLGSYRVKDIPGAIELLQLCGDGLPNAFPPLLSLDRKATAVMTVVYADAVASVAKATHAQLPEWQGPLYRLFRCAADEFDGRHLKLLGDGCAVAFEDPRAAVAFARKVCAHAEFALRAGVGAGLVELVEGELTGVPFYEAGQASKRAAAGEVVLSEVAQALLGHAAAPIA